MAQETASEDVVRGNTVDMTSGSITRSLVLFAIPLLITNFFQQFYVTVSSMIVGQFAGNVALAAIGNCGFVISTIIQFAVGISVGAGVVLAQRWGAREYERFGRGVWCVLWLALIVGFIVSATCFALARPILASMNLDGEVLDQAVLYMRTYAFGILPLVIYNMGSAVFRSYGDSNTPTRILMVCAVINLALSALFIAVMDLGLWGAAMATDIAQALEAAAALFYIWRRRDVNRFDPAKPVWDSTLVRHMLAIGIPNGIQMTVICVSSIIISAQINLYGLVAMDGFSAYSKIDGWFYMPVGAIQSAITTFVGQNVGAGQFVRARKGFNVGAVMNILVSYSIIGAVFLARYQILGLFSPDADVVRAAVDCMVIVVPIYGVYAYMMSMSGMFYGTGTTMAPMLFSVAFMCVFRIVWVYAIQLVWPSPQAIYMSYPVAWICMVVGLVVYRKLGKWKYKDEIMAREALG